MTTWRGQGGRVASRGVALSDAFISYGLSSRVLAPARSQSSRSFNCRRSGLDRGGFVVMQCAFNILESELRTELAEPRLKIWNGATAR
jgi:hypothetical protein